ncbi:MAG: monophosphatase [Actinomycetota bacterium]|nr:impA [Cryptosporangiaceae bacterium]MDQ1675267.1 monophosphatase [Actinomycetota bacterium]
MTSTRSDLDTLGATAVEILTAAEGPFVAALRSVPTVDKGGSDFATDADLAIERLVAEQLTRRTGIGVHGEEHGGPPAAEGAMWILDPVDGTANYTRGIPLTGINLALLVDGCPALGLSWLPLLDQRYTAVEGGPLRCNGTELAPLRPGPLADVVVGFGNPHKSGPGKGRFPTAYRLALLEAIARRSLRVRVLGSTAVDLAWVASGMLGAAVCFGNHPWDTAPGARLIRSAGGIVTDLGGTPHGFDSRSVLAGAPGVHGEMLEVLAAVGDPADYA